MPRGSFNPRSKSCGSWTSCCSRRQKCSRLGEATLPTAQAQCSSASLPRGKLTSLRRQSCLSRKDRTHIDRRHDCDRIRLDGRVPLTEVLVWSLCYAIAGVAPAGTDLIYFAFVNYTATAT